MMRASLIIFIFYSNLLYASSDGNWFYRIGPSLVVYNTKANINVNDYYLNNAKASAKKNETIIFDIGYNITDRISIMVMGGVPPRTSLNGRGTLDNVGNLGAVRYAPIFITSTYTVPITQKVTTYLGGGMAYAIILKDYDGFVNNLRVNNNTGPVFQFGVNYKLSDNKYIFLDYKHLWLNLKAHGNVEKYKIKASIDLDPDIISIGYKYLF